MHIKEPLVIIGNGPSFNDVDINLLRGKDTYGLNGAYKLYPELNWWPKYWSAFDHQWIRSGNRFDDINKMLVDPNCLIEHIILLKQEAPWEYTQSNKLITITTRPYPAIFNATKFGLYLGYKKIIYVGVDCSYSALNEFQYCSPKITVASDPVDSYNRQILIDDYNNCHQIAINNWEEYLVACNLIHEDSFTAITKEYDKVDFVNCSGPKSNLKALRRGNLEEEIITYERTISVSKFATRHIDSI